MKQRLIFVSILWLLIATVSFAQTPEEVRAGIPDVAGVDYQRCFEMLKEHVSEKIYPEIEKLMKERLGI